MRKIIVLALSLCALGCTSVPLSNGPDDLESNQSDGGVGHTTPTDKDADTESDSDVGDEDSETSPDAIIDTGEEDVSTEDPIDSDTGDSDTGDSDTEENTEENTGENTEDVIIADTEEVIIADTEEVIIADTEEDTEDSDTEFEEDSDIDTEEEVPYCKDGWEPMITLAFDASYDSGYSTALPELEVRDMNGTFYSLVNRVIHGGCLTAPELKEIAAKGHEIASHTMSYPNLTALNEEDLQWELEESKLWLEEVTEQEVVSFASPMGYVNDRVMAGIKKHYTNHRGGHKGINSSGDDPYALKAYSVDTKDSVASITELIDAAINNDEWIILYWHKITDTPTGWTYLTEDFAMILDHIEDRGVRVVTTKKGTSIMSCRQE